MLVCTSFVVISVNTDQDLTGNAFYITNEGGMSVTEPGAPLPDEISNIDTVFCGISAILFMILLLIVRRIEEKEIKSSSKKKTIKKKKKK